ncbi:adenosine deaminase [Colwellia sp. KU-HH00111]|uniref:adenosine deaminase n=1 Tax=Colwellia sp. KU-HH00111 TaxID=3127652 RepID=UPI003107A39E
MIDNTLPLMDLHRHLDGNIRPNTIWQLAEKNHIVLPTSNFEEFIPFVQIQHSESDLLAFLKKLDWGVAVLKDLDDVKRIAFENVEDAYNAGLDYAELRFSPYYMAMNHQLPITDVVAAVIDGVNQGIKTFDIKINLIGILSRTFGVEQCHKELTALLEHKHHLIAVDLAGDEYNFPGALFVEHFKKVRDAGLQVTVHAGEAGGANSVWQAINELGATRIGHGVATIEDEKLMAYMVNHNIAIESCLTSNFQTGTVTDLTLHPLKRFLDYGIKACLNTDDPAVQGIEIKNEYQVARQVLKLNDNDITKLQQNAIDVCFLSSTEKAGLLKNQTL